MSTDIIAELAESNDISIEDATSLLLAVLDDVKVNKKKATKKKAEKYVDIEYTGDVTFTCNTCDSVFNRTFTTNIKNQHLYKSAPACIYCKDALLSKRKEDLIVMILSDRKDIKKIV